MPYPVTHYCTLIMTNGSEANLGYSCDDASLQTDALRAATLAGYRNLQRTDKQVFIFNGVGSVGEALGNRVDISGAGLLAGRLRFVGVLAHELGHTYGLSHAASLDCLGVWVPAGLTPLEQPSCPVSRYGDPDDPMGADTREFNVVHKAALGYLTNGNIADAGTASGTSQTFVLDASETPSTGITMVRVPLFASDPTTYYFVEYRRALGYDDPVRYPDNPGPFSTGITVGLRRGESVTTAVDCDTIRMALSGGPNPAINPGDGYPFNDPYRKITITPVQYLNGGAQVQVTITRG
jgi:hypothetical protein